MKKGLRILIAGTADTKADELLFMKSCNFETAFTNLPIALFSE